MELRTLRYLVAIADAGTITAAANKIHISQPALSRQMQELERELGTKLFNRKNQAISLTANGTYLVNRARQILNLTDAAITDMTDDQAINGSLAIGLGESRLNRSVLHAAKTLVTTFPDVKLKIYSGNAAEITEQLDHGLLDFGVVIDPADTYKYAYTPITGENIWGLVVPKTDPLAKFAAVTPKMIRHQPLIISERQPVVTLFEKWAGPNFDPAQIVARFNLAYNAGILTNLGLGYTVGLDHLLDNREMALSFIPFSPKLTTRMTLIWTRHAPMSRTAQKFLTIFQQQNPSPAT